MSFSLTGVFMIGLTLLCAVSTTCRAAEEPALHLNLRSRPTEVKDQTADPKVIEKSAEWQAKKTAIIVVDMWDDHWCKAASRRVSELAVPMNQMLKTARAQGVFIIHSPSSVTGFYKDTPQRKLAQSAAFVPTPIALSKDERWGTNWCWPDKSHEGEFPIDDSDMGCDCETHCTIREAWTRENPLIEIADNDAITDNGQEAWNLLQARGIDNVILCGVHLNMCVLGRPVGIRQMVRLGKHVALMRDMTDTMYNHEKKPYVDHFAGTQLVIDHVEKYWCPSFLSSDITGGKAFRFKEDKTEQPGKAEVKSSNPATTNASNTATVKSPNPVTENAAKSATLKPSGNFESEIAAFEAADKKSPPPTGAILFVGDSAIRMWTTLAKDFPDQKVINRGFGGSQAVDSVFYADRIVIPYRPRLIIFKAGGNDLTAGKSPEQILADFQAFVTKVRAALPGVRIAYQGINPNPARWSQKPQREKTNALIKAYVASEKNLDFIEMWDIFLGPDGKPREDLFISDRLHNNAAGYKIMADAVRPHLGEAEKK